MDGQNISHNCYQLAWNNRVDDFGDKFASIDNWGMKTKVEFLKVWKKPTREKI